MRKMIFIMTLAFFLISLSACGSSNHQSDPTGKTTGSHAGESLQPKQENHHQKKKPEQKTTKTKNANASSQQEHKKSKPSSPAEPQMGTVTAVRLADSQTGWVGGKGWIAKTNNGGKNWTIQYRGKQTVHQLFALNHKDIWATFENSPEQKVPMQLLKSTDGGEHWSPAGQVPNTEFLHFISTNVAFSGNVETLDGGKTWTRLSIPDHVVGEPYFHDQNNGWVVTSSKNMLNVERTTDGGKSWHIVMTRKTVAPPTGAVIRSAGPNDAWVGCIGDSGMTQTSYSLFHTTDGGKHWVTVIANSTAGGGPAPGFPMNYTDGPHNKGSDPGPLYVVNSTVAFMGGECPACDQPNSIGWTKDGGKTWVNGEASFKGYGPAYLAIADADHGWWITTNIQDQKTSTMYTTSDGGKRWTKVHTFK